MHVAALENGKRCFDTYVSPMQSVTVVDIGAQDVNDSLKMHMSGARQVHRCGLCRRQRRGCHRVAELLRTFRDVLSSVS
jgi:hypothetical protein